MEIRIKNNQGNRTLPMCQNKEPMTDPKEMDIDVMPNKEFKLTVLRKHTKLQENEKRQINQGNNNETKEQ